MQKKKRTLAKGDSSFWGTEEENRAACATFIYTKDGSSSEEVLVYREHLTRLGTTVPRFPSVLSLTKFINTGLSRLDFNPYDIDLFVDISKLSPDMPQIIPGKSHAGLASGFQFLELEEITSVIKNEILDINAQVYYPIVDDKIFRKVVECWAKFHDKRIERKRKAALFQVGQFFKGQGELNITLSFLSAQAGENVGDDLRLQQLRGLHEFWELSLHKPNHCEIDRELIQFVIAMLNRADRNSTTQETACGALQALSSTGGKDMRNRLVDLKVVQNALDCIRLNVGNLLSDPPPKAALYLLDVISCFREDPKTFGFVLGEIGFFTSCLQSGTSDQFTSRVVSLFLPVLSWRQFSDTPCTVQSTVRYSSSKKPLGRSTVLCIGSTQLHSAVLLDFIKEVVNHATTSRDLGIKVGASLFLSNLATAAAFQEVQCLTSGEYCGGKSKHVSFGPNYVPKLHSLRELILSMRTVPVQVSYMLRWALASIAKISFLNAPPGQLGRSKLSILMYESSASSNKQQQQHTTSASGDESEDDGFLKLPPGMGESYQNMVMSSAGWSYKYDEGRNGIEFEDILLEIVFNCVTIMYEWCASVEQQSCIDNVTYVRYKTSSVIPNTGTHITDREVESVFSCLAHVHGFIVDEWLSAHIKHCDIKGWKVSSGNRQEQLETLCLAGMEKLLRVPQCADRIIVSFGLPIQPVKYKGHGRRRRRSTSLLRPSKDSRSSNHSNQTNDSVVDRPAIARDDSSMPTSRLIHVLRSTRTSVDDIYVDERNEKGQGHRHSSSLMWPCAPVINALNATQSRTVVASEICSQNILHVLSSGAVGFCLVKYEYDLEGLLNMLNFVPVRYKPSEQSRMMIAASVMLLTYGPVGLNTESAIVNKSLAVFGQRAEDPLRLEIIKGYTNHLKNGTTHVYSERVLGLLIDVVKDEATTSSILSYLIMSIWCLCRSKVNCATLLRAGDSSGSRVVHILFDIVGCQVRLVGAACSGKKTPATTTTVRLDVIEACVSALWLIAAQQKVKAPSDEPLTGSSQELFLDLSLIFALQKTIKLIMTLSDFVETVSDEESELSTLQPRRVILLALNFFWSVVDIYEPLFLSLFRTHNVWILRSLHTISTSSFLDSYIRTRSAGILAYFVRRIDMNLQRSREKESKEKAKELRSSLKDSVGEHGLLNMSLSMIKDSKCSKLRSVGCLLLATTKLTVTQHVLVREQRGLPLLIDLATEKSHHERRCALLALLNCARSGESQEIIAKYGLYRLLICSWISAASALQPSATTAAALASLMAGNGVGASPTNADQEVIQHLTATLLSILSQNSANRTKIYEAEMRAKQIQGWFNFENDVIPDYSQTLQKEREKRKEYERFQKKKEKRIPNPDDIAVKESFLDWIKIIDRDVSDREQKDKTDDDYLLFDEESSRENELEKESILGLEHLDLRKAARIVDSLSDTQKRRPKKPRFVTSPDVSSLWPYRTSILPVTVEGFAAEDINGGDHNDESEDESPLEDYESGYGGSVAGGSVNDRGGTASTVIESRKYENLHLVIPQVLGGNDDEEDSEDEDMMFEGGCYTGSMKIRKQKDVLEKLEAARANANAITAKTPGVGNSKGLRGTTVMLLKSPTRPNVSSPKATSPRKKLVRKSTSPSRKTHTGFSLDSTPVKSMGNFNLPEDVLLEEEEAARVKKLETFRRQANNSLNQRMRSPTKNLWEAYQSTQSPWTPRISNATETVVKVEKETFSFKHSEKKQKAKKVGAKSETPQEFLDRYSKRAKKRKELLKGYVSKDKVFAIFRHVEGSRVYDELPVYDAPLGQKNNVYFKGEQDIISSFLDEKELGLPQKPTSVFALGRVSLNPAAVDGTEPPVLKQQWEALVEALNKVPKNPSSTNLNTRAMRIISGYLSVSMVRSAFPAIPDLSPTVSAEQLEPYLDEVLHASAAPPNYTMFSTMENQIPAKPTNLLDLERVELGQSETQVIWTEVGRIVDDPLMFVLRAPARLRKLIDAFLYNSNNGDEGLDLETSAFRGRRRFMDDNPIAKACFTFDWDLARKGKNFRDFLSRFSPEDVKTARTMMTNASPIICAAFRFYCALTPQNPFAMLPKSFFRFLVDVGLLENEEATFKESCNNLFIKVARSVPDTLTSAMKLVNEKCDPLGIKKARRLMRHEFFELLIRLAAFKYIDANPICVKLTEAVDNLLKLNIVRYLGPETVLDFDSWRIRRLYNTNVSNLFLEHRDMLKSWFNELAGLNMRSRKWGGKEKVRMSIHEWHKGLRGLGLFSPNFTQRESTYAFALSATHVVNWVSNWEPVVALTYQDFLEAIGRATELIIIPTKDQLEFFGVCDIVEFYRLMERTNLWSAVDQAASDSETRLSLWSNTPVEDVTFDTRPLSTKLADFLKLLACRHGILRDRKQEGSFWKRKGTTGTGRTRGIGVSERNLLKREYKEKKRLEREKSKQLAAMKEESQDSSGTDSDFDDDDDALEADMEESINKVSNTLETFEITTASKLHEIWRSNRKQSDGTFEPRIKVIQGKEYDIANLAFKDLPDYFKLENLLASNVACNSIRKAWNTLQRCNSAEQSLDDEIEKQAKIEQMEEKQASAKLKQVEGSGAVVVEKKDVEVEEDETEEQKLEKFRKLLSSTEFVESASEDQHINWLKRNGKHPWVSEEQKLPYTELSEEEKQKDRVIVLAAIEVYLKNNFAAQE